MRQKLAVVLGVAAVSAVAFAQSSDEINRALAAAPRNMKDATTVIKWKPDHTYETLKKGTNQLACRDRSGEPGAPAFAVMCTNLGNLPREAQNQKFAAEYKEKGPREAAIAAAEKAGTREKPVYGSVWIHMSGPDEEHAHIHDTIAVPGATTQSTGLPDTRTQGGGWIMNAGTMTAHIMIPGS